MMSLSVGFNVWGGVDSCLVDARPHHGRPISGSSTCLDTMCDGTPCRAENGPAIDLPQLVDHLKGQGLLPPILLRFPSIACHRLEKLRVSGDGWVQPSAAVIPLTEAECLQGWRG